MECGLALSRWQVQVFNENNNNDISPSCPLSSEGLSESGWARGDGRCPGSVSEGELRVRDDPGGTPAHPRSLGSREFRAATQSGHKQRSDLGPRLQYHIAALKRPTLLMYSISFLSHRGSVGWTFQEREKVPGSTFKLSP